MEPGVDIKNVQKKKSFSSHRSGVFQKKIINIQSETSVHSNKTRNFPPDLSSLSCCESEGKKEQPAAYQLQLNFETKSVIRSEKHKEYLREAWSVQQLPSTFDSTPQPSAILEKLLLERKNTYGNAICEFDKALEDLQASCEEEIVSKETDVQIEIDGFRCKIEELKSELCKTCCLEKDQYKKFKNEVAGLLMKETEAIERLHDMSSSIELGRREKAAEIFKTYYDILRQLFYLPSKELRQMMEDKIKEYNRSAIENHKKFEDVKIKLLYETELYRESFCNWKKEFKENNRAICRKNAFNAFNEEYDEYNRATLRYFESANGLASFRRLQSRKNLITENLASWDYSVPFGVTRFYEQQIQLNIVIGSMDSVIRTFIKSYHSHMTIHQGRLRKKLERIKEIVDCSEESMIDEELDEAESKYEKLKSELEAFIEEMTSKWERAFTMIKVEADTFFKFWKDFGSPWDVQAASIAKQQEAVVNQLGSRALKLEQVHYDLQHKLNVEIEKMREEENQTKLDKKLTQVIAMVDKKNAKYKSDFEEDCKIIRKCTENIRKEVGVMHSKIEKFLQANKVEPPDESFDSSSSHGGEVECRCDWNDGELIFYELDAMDEQTASFGKWKLKILRNILAYQPNLQQNIMDIVKEWEDELINEASVCLQMNLDAVEQLRLDIHEKIYDVRLNEMIDHKNQLEKLKKTIGMTIAEAPVCFPELLNFTELVENYKIEAVATIDEYASKVRNTSTIKCLLTVLAKLKENCKNKIDFIKTGFENRAQRRTFLMRNSVESFLSNIRLFKEGGSYGVEELNFAKKETALILKSIQKDETDGQLFIKKTVDEALTTIDITEKSHVDCINVTMQKLKIQEDLSIALIQCEISVKKRMKKLTNLIDHMIEEYKNLCDKCSNQADICEVVIVLNNLMKATEKVLGFMQGPFPTKEDLREATVLKKYIDSSNNNAPNNSLGNETFVSAIIKLIYNVLTVINKGSEDYRIIFSAKIDHPSFTGTNYSCESSIINASDRFDSICNLIFDFWDDILKHFFKFFEAAKPPSIEWYLKKDQPQESSTETLEADDDNMKINNKFERFQQKLEEMLYSLQSKNDCNQIYNKADNEVIKEITQLN